MRRILIIFAVLLLVLIVGCAKVQKEAETPATAQSVDVGSSQSISETEDIEDITDAEGEKELDNLGSALDGW